jgi:hypothetical protein
LDPLLLSSYGEDQQNDLNLREEPDAFWKVNLIDLEMGKKLNIWEYPQIEAFRYLFPPFSFAAAAMTLIVLRHSGCL